MNEDIEKLKEKLKKKLENYELDKKIGQLSVDSIYSMFPTESKLLLDYIEQFELSLKCANEMLEIQGCNGNYNYDSYMLGMYNGMEYIISLFEHREPNYRNGKEIEFLNDKQLQHNWDELKKWLESWLENDKYCYLAENPIDKCRCEVYKELLNKMQELENNNGKEN